MLTIFRLQEQLTPAALDNIRRLQFSYNELFLIGLYADGTKLGISICHSSFKTPEVQVYLPCKELCYLLQDDKLYREDRVGWWLEGVDDLADYYMKRYYKESEFKKTVLALAAEQGVTQ